MLIDRTYVFSPGFNQTIIILYYDVIILKFIPGIFILINNKNQIGCEHAFIDIKETLNKLEIKQKNECKWIAFTTDFEKSLINAYNKVFNENNNLRHIGCYFHYMINIRKKLLQEGFDTKKEKDNYKLILNFLGKLPFEKDIDKTIKIKIIF